MTSRLGAAPPALIAAAMVVCAIAGSLAVRLVASMVPNAGGVGPHAAYLVVIRQAPIPVVQEATSWAVLVAVWLTFAAVAFLGYRLSKSGCRPGLVVVTFAVVCSVLTFFPIAQSIDIYYYAAYARLFGVHGINPYDLPVALTLNDPTLSENLKVLSNPPFADSYGPGFTLLAGLVGRLFAASPLFWQLWIWRALSVTGACAVMLGLLKIVGRTAARTSSTERIASFAFNPLVMYEAGVGGHNDWLMVAPAVWAFVVVDETPLIAGLLIGVAVSVKYMAVVALPFLALRAGKRNRIAGALVVVLAAVLTALCARPFAFGQAAAHTMATVGSQLSMSLTWLLTLPLFSAGVAQVPIQPGLEISYLGPVTWPRVIQLTIIAAFGGIVAASLFRYAVASASRHIYRSMTALVWALPAMHPWYLVWLSPALADGRCWGTYTAWYLSMGLLVYAHEGLVSSPWREGVFALIVLAMLAVPVWASLREPRTV